MDYVKQAQTNFPVVFLLCVMSFRLKLRTDCSRRNVECNFLKHSKPTKDTFTKQNFEKNTSLKNVNLNDDVIWPKNCKTWDHIRRMSKISRDLFVTGGTVTKNRGVDRTDRTRRFRSYPKSYRSFGTWRDRVSNYPGNRFADFFRWWRGGGGNPDFDFGLLENF